MSSPENERPIAVLLNANARKVTERVKQSFEEFVPKASLFMSHTKDEARDYIKHIVDNKYKVIFSGGGDGSFVHLINMARTYINEKNKEFTEFGQNVKSNLSKVEFPSFGVLKLGTGNGISTFTGSRKGTGLLKKTFDNEDFETMDLSLVEGDGKIFHFGGTGFDAQCLKDYHGFVNSLSSTFAKKYLTGFIGYMISGFGKSVPRSIFRPDRGEVKVEVMEGDAFMIDNSSGRDEVVPVDASVLYEGPSTIVAASTVPFYGLNVRAFPFANVKEGYVNLRVLIAKPVKVVANMRRFWTGSYRGTGVADFFIKKAKVTYEKSTSLQIGGDFERVTDSMVYSLFPQTLKLVDFRGVEL